MHTKNCRGVSESIIIMLWVPEVTKAGTKIFTQGYPLIYAKLFPELTFRTGLIYRVNKHIDEVLAG